MGDLILEDPRVIIMNCDERLSKRFFDYMFAWHFEFLAGSIARQYFLEFWEERKTGQDIAPFIVPLQAYIADRVRNYFDNEVAISVCAEVQISIDNYRRGYDVAVRVQATRNAIKEFWRSESMWNKIHIEELDVVRYQMKTGKKIESRTY